MDNQGQQYGRKCQLLVYQSGNRDALDLSNLRIKFSVKQSDAQTPNTADIRVYNLSSETALAIYANLSPNYQASNPVRGKVILQAGYESNYGVIFQGNIKQVIIGRESATDTFVDLVCGDGDRAYNFAVVNTTLAKGSGPADQVAAAVTTTTPKGVTLGHASTLPITRLPRGKVMYGNARNYLRDVAQSTNHVWSIQNEQITFIPSKSYLPGERVILTSKTGLVGTPQQTTEGVNVKCLLNPKLRIGGLIDINEASVADFKMNFEVKGSIANLPAPLSADGVYYNLVINHSGDTRGVDWYSTILGITTHVTSNPINSVSVGGSV